MEMAFSDFRKNNIERVHNVIKVISNKIDAKSIELSTEEEMRQINLKAQIEQI